MDKKVIAIAILAVLFLSQTCSKCTGNRKAEYNERNNVAKIDSITKIKDSLFLYSKDLEGQIEILKTDNFNLKTQVDLLKEANKGLITDKQILNNDKKTLNKIINNTK